MFSADWLTLREPADSAARSSALVRAIAVGKSRPMRALDLACGTGANARYVADHSRVPQDWLLVDHDPVLLDHVPARLSAWTAARGTGLIVEAGEFRVTRSGLGDASFRTRRVDLGSLDDPTLFEGRNVVTASALLDLVSETWVRRLAHRCREVEAAALFALTYDGRIACVPEDPDDEMIRRLVNDHQRTDKGFGPALGPSALGVVERCFTEVGYRSRRERTDWTLLPDWDDLQRQLIAGWSEAAEAMAPEHRFRIGSWRERRHARIDRGGSQIVVGHEDIAFWIGSGDER